MGSGYGQGDERIADYVEKVFNPQDDFLKDIRKRSLDAGLPDIQVAPMDGRHLEVLTRLSQTKVAVEIGTLGGYSGVCILRGMPADGKLYTFEINQRNADVAKETFKRAGFGDRVEIIVGAAAMNLPLYSNKGPFDLVFIDADKPTYPYYLKWATEHLRVGGVVIGDNTFRWGEVAMDDDELKQNGVDVEGVRAMRDFNHEAAQSKRLTSTIFPTCEGLTVGVKIK